MSYEPDICQNSVYNGGTGAGATAQCSPGSIKPGIPQDEERTETGRVFHARSVAVGLNTGEGQPHSARGIPSVTRTGNGEPNAKGARG